MRRFSKFLLIIFLAKIFLSPISYPAQAAGASLLFSPSSGSFDVGKSFNINVAVNSGGGLGINAADGLIKFDPAYLTVTKVSDVGSIFKLWTTDPTYSNSAGTVSFGGGSPGAYKGSAGTIFTISFSSKKTGDTIVSFSSGNVLAADGKGTNIISGLGKANFSIIEAKKEEPKEVIKKTKKKEEPKEEKPKGLLPPMPDANSKTHPKTDQWYSNNEPEFNWKILPDLTGVSFSITDNPNDDPGQENDGIIESEKFTMQKDGEQYFHIKFQNQYGWGQVAHRKLMIDATPPEPFTLSVDNQGDSTNPKPHLVFSTIDKTSGIDHYVVKIGGESTKIGISEIISGYYQTMVLSPGEYIADVAAVDKAGNSSSSTVSFIVEPLKAPIIPSIPETISKKDELLVQGTSFYPNVYVKVFIGQTGQETISSQVETDESGNWSFLHKGNLKKGSYEVWAIIVDKRGAMSLDSSKKILTVVSPSIVSVYGFWIILILLLIILALVIYILYQRKEFIVEKLRIKRETEELKVKMSKIFYALREEVDELIELADKKAGLSESERRVKEKLQESLDISEEFIGKEIDDVEKEINLPKKNS